jgi:hypothetical protein
MRDTKNAYKILIGKAEEKRPLPWARVQWRAEFKMVV